MNDLDKNYSPNEIEEQWYKIWEDSKYFAASLSSEKENYSIVIPPPNVTGILHMYPVELLDSLNQRKEYMQVLFENHFCQ